MEGDATLEGPLSVPSQAGHHQPPQQQQRQQVNWTPEMEVALLQALIKWRPVGVHRFFRILNVQRALAKQTQQDIGVDEIWHKVGTWYDVQALEQAIRDQEEDAQSPLPIYHSDAPFKGPEEFALPSEEFEPIIAEFRKATPSSPRRGGQAAAAEREPHSPHTPSGGRRPAHPPSATSPRGREREGEEELASGKGRASRARAASLQPTSPTGSGAATSAAASGAVKTMDPEQPATSAASKRKRK